jgi:hypothetical protein
MNLGTNIHYLENINTEADTESILFRMGYKRGKTLVDCESMEKISSGISEGRNLCALKGVYGRFGVRYKDFLRVQLDNNALFESGMLAELLKDSREVFLMAATAGAAVVERAGMEVNSGNASLGVILDATASETVDSALDWMQDFINKMLEREGRALTRRYSPGYGDLQLHAQKMVFASLELENIGLSITERYLLVPEKSVIAIAGVIENK